MIKKKICVVTGTRAEYGLFFPIMRKIQSSDCLELQIVATTMHFSEEFGNTYREIEKDGFFIDEKIENLLSSDTKSSIAKSTGLAMILLSDAFSRLNPDIVLVLGDRFETHAAATTAMLMNVPIAHIHGGEITEGAVDEKIRHSITKMSSLHFTSTVEYRDRVMQMGEPSDTVFSVGAPGIDNIVNMELLNKDELEDELAWGINKVTALFTFHSETLSFVDTREEIKRILEVIDDTSINVIFTYANSDDGGRLVNNEIEEFASKDKEKYLVVKSLGQLKYLSAMKHVDLLVGNTSSGIIEAASFNKPVVNIGSRQLGRIQSGNIINCEVKQLKNCIEKATSKEFCKKCIDIENIYGKGDAAQKIVEILEVQKLTRTKVFYNL
ncbi:MAG TPA: UDP-N-acetylglucosamine 2-epimerase (hydrolyzing) [Nitrospinaceae bacterium]|jgi:UDP-hydrolysing UDP-N-acetyl-D-glucosamine 2-epimerase|nr:UDP-N-acetylglucosamine 2-epimerase (hydrolyzing) [Nitrospinaceae bacterium]